jgi:3-phenylpropionate/trans-cinnamate dioxygenase ferredoxin subunit
MTKTTIEAAKLDEIKPGKMKRVAVEGKRHVLLCNVDDEYYAVDDLCTHEDMSLYLGCMKGDLVQCSLHGGKFNVKTGEPAEEPAEVPLNTYEVVIEDDTVFIKV